MSVSRPEPERPLPACIAMRLEALYELCLEHRVRRLALFGSATRDDFDPARSDLDLVVEFQPMPPTEHAQHFFALLEALRELFHRPVDLVESIAVRNPYRHARIMAQQVPLYAA